METADSETIATIQSDEATCGSCGRSIQVARSGHPFWPEDQPLACIHCIDCDTHWAMECTFEYWTKVFNIPPALEDAVGATEDTAS